MLDVECFINAQKIMWVKRLTKTGTGSWRSYPNYLMEKIAGKHSFQCNTNTIDKGQIWPKFYQQVFKAWAKVRETPDDDPFKIRREIIWWNKDISLKKKEIFYKEWFDKGIIIVHDILDENGNFKTKQDLEDEFGLAIDTMKYNHLKLSIPQKWKRCVKSMTIHKQVISNKEQPFINCNNRLLALGVTTNKDVYWELVTKKQIKPIVAHSWCTRYDIPEPDWKVIFKNMVVLKDSKMKAFQFKVLYNIIPCNLYLKRIGRSNTDKCPSCNEIEDLVHYFIGCSRPDNIWLQIRRWWQGITGQDIDITERDIIIGLGKREFKIIKQEQLNKIMTVVKWKIHTSKQQGDTCCLYQILNNIRSMIKIEELIAVKNNRLKIHQEAWNEIEDYLT
jgi:hypothetical protein